MKARWAASACRAAGVAASSRARLIAAFAGLLIFAVAFATIAGAWIFEAAGYLPCDLCLKQRWVYYAGVPLAGMVPADLLHPVPTGIVLALFIGKKTGVLLSCWLAVRPGLAALPGGVQSQTSLSLFHVSLDGAAGSPDRWAKQRYKASTSC